MPPIRLPTLPPTGGLDFAPVAEGESGLDIQISPGRMGGGGNTFDAPTAGAELQAGQIYFNRTTTANMVANPTAYAGTFMTDFSGQILAGRRLDGLSPVAPATPWSSAAPFNIAAGSVVRTGLSNDIKIVSGAAVGAPNIYSRAGGIGLDIFFTPAVYAPAVLEVTFVFIPRWNANSAANITIIAAGVPRIVNNPNLVVPGYVNVNASSLPIKTAPRPEGYSPGETGIQIFWNQLGAVTPQPAGFSPIPVGFPYVVSASGGAAIPTLRWDVL